MKLVRFGKRIEEDLLEVDAVERDERSLARQSVETVSLGLIRLPIQNRSVSVTPALSVHGRFRQKLFVDPKLLDHSPRPRPNTDTRANFAMLGSGLVDVDLQVWVARKGQSCNKSTDSTAANGNPQRRLGHQAEIVGWEKGE